MLERFNLIKQHIDTKRDEAEYERQIIRMWRDFHKNMVVDENYKPLNKIDKVISDLMLPENQTKEKAHERLLRAGIIDENGNLNEPYK